MFNGVLHEVLLTFKNNPELVISVLLLIWKSITSPADSGDHPVILVFEFFDCVINTGLFPETIVEVVGYDANVDFFRSQAIVPEEEATTYHPITVQSYGMTL